MILFYYFFNIYINTFIYICIYIYIIHRYIYIYLACKLNARRRYGEHKNEVLLVRKSFLYYFPVIHPFWQKRKNRRGWGWSTININFLLPWWTYLCIVFKLTEWEHSWKKINLSWSVHVILLWNELKPYTDLFLLCDLYIYSFFLFQIYPISRALS